MIKQQKYMVTLQKKNLLLNKKQNFGEGYAYWEYLNSLSNIEFLIKKI